MSETQRVIKNVAFAFAIFLIIIIFSGILYGIKAIYYIFEGNETIFVDKGNELQMVENVEIELLGTSLIIKESPSFKYETNNANIKFIVDDNKLYVHEKRKNWFINDTDSTLILYIPSDIVFNSFEFESGAGKIDIENLIISNGDFNLGAGKVTINELNVLNKIKVEGGAGELSITDSSINSLDLDMGVGKLYLNSYITDNSELNLGIGKADIILKGNKEDYKVFVNKGIGSFSIDGLNKSDGDVYGEGYTNITINGGIGNIEVNYE